MAPAPRTGGGRAMWKNLGFDGSLRKRRFESSSAHGTVEPAPRAQEHSLGGLGALPAEDRELAQPAGESASLAVTVGRNVEVRIRGAERQVQFLAGRREFHDVVLV